MGDCLDGALSEDSKKTYVEEDQERPVLPFGEVLTDNVQLEDDLVGVVVLAEKFPHLATSSTVRRERAPQRYRKDELTM